MMVLRSLIRSDGLGLSFVWLSALWRRLKVGVFVTSIPGTSLFIKAVCERLLVKQMMEYLEK